jgi:cell wall-active antibiotic response 4TMS protein YvqF
MSSTASHPGGGVRWLGGSREWYFGRVFMALVLLGFGVVAVLDSAGTLNGDRAIDHWWPTILILAGATRLLEGRRSQTVSLVLVGLGAALLPFTTNLVHGNEGDYVGPAIMIGLALLVLAHARVRPLPAGGDQTSGLRLDGILSRPEASSSSDSFRGAFLTAFLGHVTLDLRQARPAPGAIVSATASLGGIDILVPRGWRINVKGTPLLGSIHDKTDRAEPPAEDAPTLEIDALALLGGVDVKHER